MVYRALGWKLKIVISKYLDDSETAFVLLFLFFSMPSYYTVRFSFTYFTLLSVCH